MMINDKTIASQLSPREFLVLQSPCAEQCFAILYQESVRMSITVQQLVMSARTGKLHVRTQHSGSPNGPPQAK